jgi:hypothetical protein
MFLRKREVSKKKNSRAKALACCFVVGGAYAVVGQALLLVFQALLGGESPFAVPCTLVGLGVVAFVMYVSGLHQRLAKVSGFGSILPFNGFACGMADAFESAARETDSFKNGLVGLLQLFGYAVALGIVVNVLAALLLELV